jgi:hypothetical protein
MSHVEKGTNAKRCFYDECLGDADCGERGACLCRESIPHVCVSGTCRVDADCPAPHACAFSPGADVMTRYGRVLDHDRGFFCRTPSDTCASDDDCLAKRCAFVSERHQWECRNAVVLD